jgi:hypothetical protein
LPRVHSVELRVLRRFTTGCHDGRNLVNPRGGRDGGGLRLKFVNQGYLVSVDVR